LKSQLKIGDRLIIPVGAAGDAQELIKLTRRSETEFEERRLGSVRFVPLGSETWWKTENDRHRPIFPGVSQRKTPADLIAEAAEFLPDLDDPAFGALFGRAPQRLVGVGFALQRSGVRIPSAPPGSPD
jgi:Protein-L-isoaspartate(D-aspartate) O-methyltransferase (PCMT)